MIKTSRAPRCLGLLAGSALVVALCGCSVPQLVRQTTPAVVDSSLAKLDDPATKQRMRNLLASPDMKAIEKELIAGVVDGSLATLSEGRRAERMGELAGRFSGVLMRGMSREMEAALLSPQSQERVRGFVGSVVQASFEPVVKNLSAIEYGPAISTAMTQQLGPALQQVLRDNLGPGIAQALDSPEVHRALGSTAHVLGQQMVLGANEALVTIQRENKQRSGEGSLLGSVSLLADKSASAITIAALVAGAMVLALALWVGRLLLERKRYQSDVEGRAATARMLSETLRGADGKPWREDLLAVLEKRFNDDEEMMLRIQAERLRKERASKPNGAPLNGSPLNGAKPIRRISTH